MAGHGGGCCHEHKHEQGEQGDLFSLYSKIDLHNVQCLNETTDGSGKDVFKPYEERLNLEKV